MESHVDFLEALFLSAFIAYRYLNSKQTDLRGKNSTKKGRLPTGLQMRKVPILERMDFSKPLGIRTSKLTNWHAWQKATGRPANYVQK